jgi:hypothetical protein
VGAIHVRLFLTDPNGRSVLTGLQPVVRETLDAIKMLTIFDVLPDRESALADLHKQSG